MQRALGVSLLAAVGAQASTDYGPAIWRPACDDYFSGGYGKRFFVIHDMEGYYAYCVSSSGILRRCSGAVVTVHYCVNGKKDRTSDYAAGEVSQLVRDSYYAWHARCWSAYSMGTEHEGFASNPAWFTEAQYVASASLTKSKCNKYNISKDRNRIIAHGQKSRSSWRSWAASAGYSSSWINCNSHTDPGPYWNWTHYMNLVKDTIAAPTAPSSPVATAFSSSQINLSWKDNSSTESGFKIERSTSSGGTYTQIATVGANVKTYSSTGLASGTAYYYRIRAYNAGGNSGYSAVVSATTKDTIPAAPTSLVATAVSSTQINLTWAQSMPNEDGFRVYSSTDNTNFTLIATVGINVVAYSNTNLLGNRTYYYKVAAYNTAGNSAFSNTASDTTAPEAPSGLVVNSVSGMANWNKLDLSWTDNSSSEVGFKVERGTAVGGPYTEVAVTGAGEAAYQDSGLAALTTYYYRVRSFNGNGNSVYSAVASRATGAAPPVLGAIGNKTVAVGNALTFTSTSSNPNQLVTTNTWQTFQSFPHNTPNETILFKKPANSTTTSSFIDTTATNYTYVVTNGPTAWGGSGNRVLKANWNFKSGFSHVWLRLHTGGVATNPSPTIALDQKLQFKAYSAHTLRFTLGVRETGTTAAYGVDGGTTGAIEWVGATAITNGVPTGGHSAPINTPVEMSFNIPFEPWLPFTGDGVIDQTGVKGTLEHIGIQGTSAGAEGLNYVYFDDLAVVTENTLAYTLDAGAPAGAAIGYRNGKFTWTPSAGQVGLHLITVRVTDRLGGHDWETFKVTVTGSGNAAPVLQPIGNKTVNEGGTVSFTVRATDADAGMVSWWPAEGSATDLNNLAHGTMSGGASYSPGKGSAFKFDGVDDYVNCGSSTTLKMTSAMTFAAWIYPTGPTNGSANMWINREGEYEVFRYADGDIGFAFANTTPGWTSISSGYAIPTNKWTHVAVTYANGVVKTYANGTLVNTYNGTGAIGDVDAAKNEFRIGGRQAGGNPNNGMIDQTTIYNRALSATEIQTLSNPNLNYTTVGLVSRWEADGNANDVNGVNSGTLSGTTYASVTKTGRAFTYDGDNDYTQMGDNSALVMSNVMSFETWIYPTGPGSASPGGGILINKEGEYEIGRYADGTIRYAFANTNPGWTWTNTGFVAPLYTWTHLVTTYSNGVFKTYGNGTLVNTINGTGLIGDVDTVNNDFRIGGRQNADQHFQGFIDETTIYRRVLSATEVSSLYNGQTKSFGTFSLDAGNPSGSSINSSSGVFTWTPGESHGPGSYPITVRITDSGSPSSNDFEVVTVTVNELNVAPVLAAIANQTVNEGATLNVTASATDADLPANTLTYSLIGPVGMTIDPSSGAIGYTPGETEGGQVHLVTVTVKDNGVPMFSNTKTFTVTVNEANTAPVLILGTLNDYNPFAEFDELDDESIDGYNDACLFRVPGFSTTTSAFLETNSSAFITNSFPQDIVNGSYQCLYVNMNFKTGTVNPWCRLSTHTDETWTNRYAYPNPTIDLSQHVRCKIWSDKSIKVAIGVRETGTLNPLGFDGGTTGTIEWLGASSSGGAPVPTRTITASNWTQLDFNLPAETIAAFDGNGVLAAGRGTLESLIIVPNGGMGNYNIYLDDFETLSVKTAPIEIDTGDVLTFTASSTDSDIPAQDRSYSLGVGSPTNAVIDEASGFFSWAATADDNGTNVVTVTVTDTGSPQLSTSQNITVVVNTVNTPPRLNSINDLVVENGSTNTFTFDTFAEDDDLPEQTVTYSISGAPAGATIDPNTGAFNWTPSGGLSTNTVKVRATDNGSPALWDEQTIVMRVVPTNNAPVLSLGTARVTETMVNFETFSPTAANGTVMFRRPTNSTATLSFIDTAVTNYTLIVTNGPSVWGSGNKSLKASWSFKTGTANYWVCLQTSNTTSVPNPTINASARVKFDVYADKSIKVGLGIRETGTSAENGANGGTTGVLEYAGCTNMSGSTPLPFRTVNPLVATNFEFDLPTEPMRTLDGNSILAGGQQVLESILIVGAGGTGVYNVYFDNFQIVTTTALPGTVTMKTNSILQFTASASDPDPGAGVTFGLEADFSEAHTNAVIDPATGAFSWTPLSADLGTTNVIAVIADDEPTNGGVPKSDFETLTVIVTADTLGPLGADGDFIAGGDTVNLSWDSVPGQTYKVQMRAKDSFAWTDAQTVTASGAKSSVSVTNGGADGYARVVADGGSDQ